MAFAVSHRGHNFPECNTAAMGAVCSAVPRAHRVEQVQLARGLGPFEYSTRRWQCFSSRRQFHQRRVPVFDFLKRPERKLCRLRHIQPSAKREIG